MNIIEHIKAGHYSTDELGRPLIKVVDKDNHRYQRSWVVVLETIGNRINTRYAHTHDILQTWDQWGHTLGPPERSFTELAPPEDWKEVSTWVKKSEEKV